MDFDILIRGGEVIDPSQQLRGIRDVAVVGGQIAAIEEHIDAEAVNTIDAQGQLVVPGLIDLHVHVYTHSPFGLDADPLCPAGGVTTMLDAGTAGSFNFDAFRRDNIDRARTQIFSLVNLSCIGLIGASLGELLDRRYADPDGVVETIGRHPDVAVGVKIRVGKHIIGDGQQGWDNLRDAIRAAREAGVWLMVHIGECPMSIPELVGELSEGDCITHCFKGGSTRITDDAGRIHDKVRAAAERGVIFDVGHGYGSFQWEVAEAAIRQDFLPTTISTDLHTKNIHGPVYDMPTTMSKFLLLGVPMEKVIEMSTTRPAAILNRCDDIGTLRVGSVADIAVLERHDGQFQFTDSYSQHRTGQELLTAAATIRRGEIVPGGGGTRMRRTVESSDLQD
ncbi:MAG: amidohydrolase/deacetylase family metallohydrolase [Fuerstiella sp.]|jgi:dihydroorotase|nr:amidohydrolase/deacetylase family metallohydrolase [Fuerstiella sp.]MCP4509995.1 amidohydrolase/deacetylase family metallohydrolase [Fuerstiella sp.]MDG2129387.1 amidohydrolase/deacetylase family metallohydrolase [Fuerstiella sp.]